jgi:hypothetical protein
LQVFKATGVLAAKFHAQISLADDFALKGRAVRDGDGHVRDLDLDAAHLDAFLHELLGFFQIILAINFIEGHGDHVFIRGDTGRQDFGDDRIRDNGEAEVDGARRRGIFQIVHFAQGQHEGKDAFLVVEQNFA